MGLKIFLAVVFRLLRGRCVKGRVGLLRMGWEVRFFGQDWGACVFGGMFSDFEIVGRGIRCDGKQGVRVIRRCAGGGIRPRAEPGDPIFRLGPPAIPLPVVRDWRARWPRLCVLPKYICADSASFPF